MGCLLIQVFVMCPEGVWMVSVNCHMESLEFKLVLQGLRDRPCHLGQISVWDSSDDDMVMALFYTGGQ